MKEIPMTEVVESEKKYYEEALKPEGSGFDLRIILRVLILNWYWFLICGAAGYAIANTYLRYIAPVYSSSAKILIKGARSGGSRSAALEFGTVVESSGISNEQEILKSSGLAADVVRNLKLYTNYSIKGRFATITLYKDQPVTVEINSDKLENLNRAMNISITRTGGTYTADISYWVPITEFEYEPTPYNKTVKITKFPTKVNTKVGTITFKKGKGDLGEKATELVSILSPQMSGYTWAGKLTVSPSRTSAVVNVSINDVNIQRSIDYLRELVNCYNLQANDDKNEKALRTEEFIAERLKKITSELDETDDRLQKFLEDNRTISIQANANRSFGKQNTYEDQLQEMQLQEELTKSLLDFARRPGNEYQVIPSNIGLTDGAASALIGQYNNLALERKRLLRTASEKSPVVEEITFQMDEAWKSLNEALDESQKSFAIKRRAMEERLGMAEEGVGNSPALERQLKYINRQEQLQSGLYMNLLQKREENDIQLASTADKAKLIEPARFVAQIAPNRNSILMMGLGIGIAIPILIFFLIEFFRYKIEGHEDVIKLTTLPVIADVAVANEKAKERGDIVVKKNTNNQMAEIFRGIRTNVQFMLPEGKKRIMMTSSLSGEGKTFISANLAVSFALLDKKVIMIGLDIRRPRLASLFKLEGVKDTQVGVSTLLTLDNPSWEDISAAIVPSEVNENLDILMAGPIPPNPSELLERPALEVILNRLSEKYDYIIMDTAPIGIVTDTVHIAKFADAAIYVTRADYTPKSCIEGLNELVETKKLQNVGIIVNGIDMSKRKNAYAYGYGRYGKYGRYGYSYGRYGKYGRYGTYGRYGSYHGSYGSYGDYKNSRYGNKKDNSVKR